MSAAKTIHEAVSTVLQEAGHPCTLDEIISGIAERRLYEFKVKDPRGVVRQAIRRRCEGYSNLDKTGKRLFREVDGKRYSLT